MSSNIEANLKPLVEAIEAGDKITFFLGAGISTSAGIPDFRSPKTGLYANLAKLNLPFAEAVFDIDYFKESPQAFYTLADDLYPGKFKPTVFHYFVKLIQDKGLLQRVYTQNIDTLERLAGVKEEYIVEAHGSFAYNHCVDCGEEMSIEELRKHMKTKGTGASGAVGIPVCPTCSGYVKPDIVFFGEGLPSRFFEMWEKDGDDVEIAIVAGTSLTVHPFASLPSEILDEETIRVLINNEAVGDFKKGYRRDTDILALNDCDSVARSICKLLGWEEELNELISETPPSDKKEEAAQASKDVARDIAETTKESTEERIDPQKETAPKKVQSPASESGSEEEDFADAVANLKI
ncbi:NAD-dependent protein deacetylase Hst2p [[Candida] railenensis]|uniref:NAD-dependent protein deacetylase n=1 Tax=[Candida] railenensis TaxID=45579 RepID=A0A9P0QQJ4_9ASCO|nr:NAD-dependent protein deacetylase Hst2p [[Candida] railenensis]